MHAGGRLGPKLGREGFRRARRRFLDEISGALGSQVAHQTTVVFDASVHPGDFALDAQYRELGIVFALGDENADARIEKLIAADSNPRTLAVVSSDRRIRQAALRRRARSFTAEEYWDLIDDLKERRHQKKTVELNPTPRSNDAEQPETTDDTQLWLEAFREVGDLLGIQDAFTPNRAILTDAEIAEIEREIERET